jgi:glycosyltransferase involved in cell wall biosynthesis
MMRNDKISVIVPCYNVENFLARCLDSLLTQTYPNIEVIMVEDCSTDNTRDIVRRYEEKYDNFRAIYNKENGGLGHARNVGIEATTSKYIGFLDSDDWLPSNYFSEMYEALVADDTDLSVCDVYLRYDDTSKDQRIVSYNGKPDKYGLINTGLAATSSAKLFKTELFENLRYPEGIVNEDIPVILAILSKYRVAYTDKTHFSYYQRPGSIQNSKITNRRFDVFKALALLRNNLDSKVDPKIWQIIVWQQLIAVFIYVIPKAQGTLYRKNLIKEFYYLTKEYDIKIVGNPGLKEFAESGRANAYYSDKVVKYLDRKQFLRLSVLMGLFGFYKAHHTLVRVPLIALRHPMRFLRALIYRLKPKKYVIKNNTDMNSIVKAAIKQQALINEAPVSVIIPNYNYERFLIQRVYSILAQSHKVGEIIILDDNSTDKSVELAQKIKAAIHQYVPVKLLNNQKNRGTFRQWESGFDIAKCDYVWIAEADDYSDAKFLQHALKPLSNNPNMVISYVNTGYINEKGLLLGNVKNDIDYQGSGHWDEDYINNGVKEASTYTYLNNTIANVSSAVFRKRPDIDYAELFADARKYRQAGDWVFYVNYMVYGDIAYTDKILNYYRIHGNNVSSTTKAQDHINEILDIQEYFVRKLDLTKTQRTKMAKRIKLLKKAWNV